MQATAFEMQPIRILSKMYNFILLNVHDSISVLPLHIPFDMSCKKWSKLVVISLQIFLPHINAFLKSRIRYPLQAMNIPKNCKCRVFTFSGLD